jgi:hypothetical protein
VAPALGTGRGLLQTQQRAKKEAVCRQAESLSHSTDWKATGEALKALQENWNTFGSCGREADDALWQRFRASLDSFYSKRAAHVEKLDYEQQQHRARKESLCVQAEALSGSTDWKATAEKLTALQAEWKRTGSAPREHEESLWRRFRVAQDQFFERRSVFYERRKTEQEGNLARKRHLCSIAESLTEASDSRAASERVRELQAEWKGIGHVSRENADVVWERFRKACDRVFTRAHEEWERKQIEWRRSLQEALERKREKASRLRESIDHDEGNISRWEDTIANLRPGGRADEIRDSLEQKIADVREKVDSKAARLGELDESIREIESKLRG